MPSSKDVADNLRRVRKSKGLTLAQVQALSNGLHQAVVIGSYERGHRNINVDRLIALAELYEVPVTSFFGPVPPPKTKIDTLIEMLNAMRDE